MKTQTVQTFTTSVIPSDISDCNNILKKFWEEQEIPSTHPSSTEDEICERFYTRTTRRHENGRYIVRLPFREEYPDKTFLGPSRFIALAQYSGMEKTLSKDPGLSTEYKSVLNEYLALDHMAATFTHEIISRDQYRLFYL